MVTLFVYLIFVFILKSPSAVPMYKVFARLYKVFARVVSVGPYRNGAFAFLILLLICFSVVDTVTLSPGLVHAPKLREYVRGYVCRYVCMTLDVCVYDSICV